MRPVYVANAPDGSIYVADFYEQYIAHGQHYQGQIDPDSGRIYRIRGRELQLTKDINLERKTSAELIEMLRHPNKWQRQTAARLLGERRDPSAEDLLRQLLRESDTHPALEALWALHQAGWLDEATIERAIAHPAAPLRAWIIRLLGDAGRCPRALLQRSSASLRPSQTRRYDARSQEPRAVFLSIKRSGWWRPFCSVMRMAMTRSFLRFAGGPFESFCDTEREKVLAFVAPAEEEKPTLPHRGRRIDLWSSTMSKEHLLPKLMRRFAAKRGGRSRCDVFRCRGGLAAGEPTAGSHRIGVRKTVVDDRSLQRVIRSGCRSEAGHGALESAPRRGSARGPSPSRRITVRSGS